MSTAFGIWARETTPGVRMSLVTVVPGHVERFSEVAGDVPAGGAWSGVPKSL